MTKRASFPTCFAFLLIFLTACTGGGQANSTEIPTLAPTLSLPSEVATAIPTPESPTMEVPGPTSPAATATTNSQPEATATELPTVMPEADTGVPDTVNLNAGNNYGEPDVDSYRLSLQFESTLTGADGSMTIGSIVIEGARDLVNNASTFSAMASGTVDFGGGQEFAFTQVNETTYFILPNGACIASEGRNPNTDLFAVFLADGGILGNLTGAMLGTPPIENINGVLTNHFEFDETNLDPVDPTTPDVTAVNGDIYLAAEGGYVVRLIMEGEGTSNLLNGIAGDGAITYELNYFDFNEPVAIVPPSGCNELPSGDN